jgi:hypothetical protein
MQRDRRRQDRRHDRERRDARFIGHRDRQDMRQHADEMHRPDAAPHREGAERQPAEAQTGIPELGDAGRKLQEGVAAQRGNQVGKQDQRVVVRARDGLRRVDIKRKVVRKSHRGLPLPSTSSRTAL